MSACLRPAVLFLVLAPGMAGAQSTSEEPTSATGPSVALSLADPSPVIGVTGESALRIEVHNPPESPMPIPRVLASAGQVEDLGREGPATFTARYILPSGRFPQPAILVAEFASGRSPLRGVLPVRLRAAATPTLSTDPGAQVTLRVADREFGPQTAPADGVVNVPVVVPPGVEFATARSVNQHGKATEQVIDLRVPYSQRLLIVPPEHLAAGSVGEVAVYAVDPSGHPANASTLVMRAQGARVQPLGSRSVGEARFLVTAPTVLKDKGLRIEAQLKGQSTTRVATRMPLVTGAATRLSLEPEASNLLRGNRDGLRVFLNAEDAYGNRVECDRADIKIDDQSAKVTSADNGAAMVLVQAPTDPRHGEIVVEGVIDNAYAVRRIPIGALSPRQPDQPAAPGASRYNLTPRLGVLWNFGPVVGFTFFVDATAYRLARYPNVGMGLSLGIVESRFDTESGTGITTARLSTVPLLFELRRRFLMGPSFVGLGGGAGFALTVGRLRSFGATVTGQAYGAAASATLESGLNLGDAQLAISLRYLVLYLTELSSGDRIAGNTAGLMADVGYRLTW